MGDNIGADFYAWVGLSTDAKPSGAIRGQRAIERDTGDVYEWRGDENKNGSWIKILRGDGSVDINIQDQTTRPILAKFNRVQNSTTLSVAAVKNATTITVASATGFVAGRYIILFEPSTENFSFYTQIGAPAGNVITLDTPLDFSYGIGTFVDSAITNLNANGSLSTPVTFGLRGTGSPPGVDISVDITRLIFHCITSGAVDLSTFGDLTALTNGLVLRKRDGDCINIFNVKTNGEIAGIMYDFDVTASTNPQQGVDGFTARLTFAGTNKIGVAVRLPIGDDLEVIVQDNISGITLLEIMAEGHIVED